MKPREYSSTRLARFRGLTLHPPEDLMHIGLCIFATDYSIRVDERARAAEERGFESLFLPEHPHIPAGRRPSD